MGRRRESVEGEVHRIGGDQMHGYIFKRKFSGGVVHPVDMPEIAGGIVVLMERINEGTAYEVQPNGREVEKYRHRRSCAILSFIFIAELLSAVQREAQTNDLSVDDLFIIHRSNRHLLSLIQKPTSGATYDLILHKIGIVVEKTNC